jgi:hypothetical protein
MIQQIYLTQRSSKVLPDLDQPMELLIDPKDLEKFHKIIEVLFDQDSVRRIMKLRRS